MKEELNTLESVESVISDHTMVMLYFYNNNCPPCLSLRPKISSLIKDKFPKIELYFSDSEKYPAIPAHYQVFSNPTIILFIEGKEHFRHSKYISEFQLSEKIERVYEMLFE